MVIAVTGHSGFIGKHLCRAILNKGWTLIKISKSFEPTKCDRIYHLACPSSTKIINDDPISIINTIINGTKEAMRVCPDAKFINASSIGANYTKGMEPQIAYNTAKRLMELYLYHTNINSINYRIPSVYGEGMSKDSFIQRCIEGSAYKPSNPDSIHYIIHINNLIQSMIKLEPLEIEKITLGEIYEDFTTGRRGLYRNALS